MSFKKYMTERKAEANKLVSVLRQLEQTGEFTWLDPEEGLQGIFSWSDLMDYFEWTLGADQIGDGMFSIAMAKGENPQYVLRVSKKAGDDNAADAMFTMSSSSKSSLNAQYIYFGTVFGHKCAVFEYLWVNSHSTAKRYYEAFEKLGEKLYTKFDVFSWHLAQYIYEPQAFEGEPAKIEKLASIFYDKPFAEIKQWHLDLQKIYPNAFAKWDLHDANLGYRKNGEVVIFDPIA